MCPDCNEPLVAFEHEGVEIDRCVVCQGTWLDAGELEQITELAGVEPGPLSAAIHAAGTGVRGNRRCPRCRKRLRVITVGTEAPIELDHCPRGHGLWFDAGEIRAVIAKFAGGEAGEVSRFFAEMFRHDLTVEEDGD